MTARMGDKSEPRTVLQGLYMAVDDKEPRIEMTPEAQTQVDEDDDLKKFMVKFSADAKNAILAVRAGRYEDFGEAMAALGYETNKFDPDEDDDDD